MASAEVDDYLGCPSTRGIQERAVALLGGCDFFNLRTALLVRHTVWGQAVEALHEDHPSWFASERWQRYADAASAALALAGLVRAGNEFEVEFDRAAARDVLAAYGAQIVRERGMLAEFMDEAWVRLKTELDEAQNALETIGALQADRAYVLPDDDHSQPAWIAVYEAAARAAGCAAAGAWRLARRRAAEDETIDPSLLCSDLRLPGPTETPRPSTDRSSRSVDAATRELLRHSLEQAIPFNLHNDVRINEVASGYGAAELPDAMHLLNHLGTQHCAALLAVAQAAAGAAYIGAFFEHLHEIRINAREAHIVYRGWAKGPIVARSTLDQDPRYVLAKLREDGRVALPMASEVYDTNGEVLATMQFRFLLKHTSGTQTDG